MAICTGNGVSIDDPLTVVLGFLERWSAEPRDASGPTTFDEPDLRLANRGGARISAAEIEAILERRYAVLAGVTYGRFQTRSRLAPVAPRVSTFRGIFAPLIS